jgi:hypothetical protein
VLDDIIKSRTYMHIYARNKLKAPPPPPFFLISVDMNSLRICMLNYRCYFLVLLFLLWISFQPPWIIYVSHHVELISSVYSFFPPYRILLVSLMYESRRVF